MNQPVTSAKDYYVLLTGGKNNAGDFLIKHRAKILLQHHRPDRTVVDMDAWKFFNKQQLAVVNGAKALLLMGGPALQRDMRPNIYPMVDNLDEIQVPIVLMGVGWKSLSGNWADTHDYPLSKSTLALLERINNSGLLSSVRDYHTHNVLFHHGFENVLMTGCPALYSLEHLHQPIVLPTAPSHISISLGVSFVHNSGMEALMKELIAQIHQAYPNAIVTTVFQHSLAKETHQQAYNHSNNVMDSHYHRHLDFANWLDSQDYSYVDISGSAENLIQHYQTCDLHIGFRVHSHIYMIGTNKPSVLLNEDGRGKALASVVGGLTFDAFDGIKPLFERTGLLRRKRTVLDRLIPVSHLSKDIIHALSYEWGSGSNQRLCAPRHAIDRLYPVMQQFMRQLP